MSSTTCVNRGAVMLLASIPVMGSACASLGSTDDEIFCEYEEVAVLSPADATLGFSAQAILARMEEQRWDVAWDGIYDLAPSFDQVDTTIVLSGDEVFHRRGSGEYGCVIDGDFLLVPATWTVSSPDDTFGAAGTGTFTATADDDSQVELNLVNADADAVPADLQALLDAGAEERGGTSPTLRVHLLDFYVSPTLSIEGVLDEPEVVATYGLASGQLSPSP